MPNVGLIPALDPAPLPGPPWLFHALWLVTFAAHLLFLNVVLGGSILGAIAAGEKAGRRATRVLAVEVNSWAISLAITFGIAPLLFMQVLFGRFFYTATILLAWPWLGMLGLLTVAYYLNYVAKFRLRRGAEAGVALPLAALLFLAIAAIQVAVQLLHLQPGRWERVADGAWAALSDPGFLPRYLHFVLAAVAMSGALAAWVGVRRAARGGEPEECRGMAGLGIQAALLATAAQIIVGFWLLLALPGDVLRAFMGGEAATLAPLTLGIVVGLALLMILSRVTDPLAQPRLVRHAAEGIVATMALMLVTRHQLRGYYLARARASETMTVETQWGPLVLFLAVFVLCAALTAYAVVRALRDRPSAGEPAA